VAAKAGRKAAQKADAEARNTDDQTEDASRAETTEDDGSTPGGNIRPAAKIIEVRPMAQTAKMRKRHWGVALTFVIVVALPLLAISWYLWDRAVDQYASTTGFTVRSEDTASSTEVLGGLSQFVGGSASADADIVFEFIQSQDMAERVDARLDLRGHYTAQWKEDPVFSLKPDSTIEDLRDYWQRVVRVSYDQATGLINIEARAFSSDMAQQIAKEILTQSQILVNELNATARADALRYAQEDLDDALTRLKLAREALVNFRTRTQIVDPQSDIQGRMGVLNGLQQQLAQALIEYDLLIQEASETDPRIVQANRRIEAIRKRIADERANFTTIDAADNVEAYPELLAEYESLTVDREFAEETYRVALAALDMARSNAARQSRYLATYVSPTLPQTAEYPKRISILGIAALFLVLFWAIISLTFYALRDRR